MKAYLRMAVFAAALVVTSAAQAAVIRIDFSGQVSASDVTTTEGAIGVGDAVSGFFLADTSVPDTGLNGSSSGFFDGALIAGQLFFGGGNVFAMLPGDNVILTSDVLGGGSPPLSGVVVTAGNVGPELSGGGAVLSTNLRFSAPGPGALPQYDAFPTVGDLNIFFANLTPNSIGDLDFAGGKGAGLVVFSLDSAHATAVPEPTAWALALAGFGLAGAMLRRRRSVAA